MAAFLDDFTDTAGTLLEAHVAGTGQTWAKHGSYSTGSAQINPAGDGAVGTTAAATVYLSSWTPPGVDHYAEMSFKTGATVAGLAFGIGLNWLSAQATGYRVNISGGTPTWKISKFLNSTTATTLATSPTFTLTANTTYLVRIVRSGSDILLYVNGTLVIQATDGAPLATAGQIMFYTVGASPVATGDKMTADANSFTALSIDTPNYGVLQCAVGTGNAGNLAIGGKTPSGTNSIEIRIKNGGTTLQAFTAVTGLTINADVWSGFINAAFVPPLAWLTFEIQAKDSGGTVITPGSTTVAANIGIGDVIWTGLGSSTPDFAFSNVSRGGGVSFPGTPSPFGTISYDSAASFHVVLTTDCYGGAYAINEHISRTGRPLAVVASAQAGTATTDWRATGSQQPKYAGAKSLRRMLCIASSIGLNDVALGFTGDAAAAAARYITMQSDARTYFGSMGPGGTRLKILMLGTQGDPSATPPADDYSRQMRMGELIVVDSDTDNSYMAGAYDKVRQGGGTNTHQAQVADGEALWGSQLGIGTAAIALGQTVPRFRCTDVQVVSATQTDLVYSIPTGFGSAIVINGGGSVVSGCEVSSDGTTFVAASTAGISGTNKIRITHASLAGSNRFLRHQDTVDAGFGTTLQAQCVRTNSTPPLTAEPTKFASVSSRPGVIRATDNVGATADLVINVPTIS